MYGTTWRELCLHGRFYTFAQMAKLLLIAEFGGKGMKYEGLSKRRESTQIMSLIYMNPGNLARNLDTSHLCKARLKSVLSFKRVKQPKRALAEILET